MNLSWKVGLVFAGIFLAGAVTGASVSIYWFRINRPAHEPGRNPVEQFRRSHFAAIEKRLELTPEQKEQIKPAIAKASEEFHHLRKLTVQETNEILERMNTEVAKFLTPEQAAKFQEMRQHQSDRMKSLMQGRGPVAPDDGGHHPDPHQPPPPPPGDTHP